MAFSDRLRPGASVVMVARDAEATVSRAIESVLGQRYGAVELVVAVLPSSDGTAGVLERAADRDVRIELVRRDDADVSAALDAALDRARRAHVMVMRPTDWLGPAAIERMVARAEADDLGLVVPTVSLDTPGSRGSTHSEVVAPSIDSALTARELRARAASAIDRGDFCMLPGKLLDLGRVRSLGLRFSVSGGEEAFLFSYLEDLDRAGSVPGAIFHAPAPAAHDRYGGVASRERCEAEHERLLDLAARWGADGGADLAVAIHRRHLRDIEGLIESVCLARRLSSIERAERIRDIVDAPSTRRTIEVLGGSRSVRRLDLMYGAIAARSVPACRIGACVSGIARGTGLPLMLGRTAAL